MLRPWCVGDLVLAREKGAKKRDRIFESRWVGFFNWLVGRDGPTYLDHGAPCFGAVNISWVFFGFLAFPRQFDLMRLELMLGIGEEEGMNLLYNPLLPAN